MWPERIRSEGIAMSTRVIGPEDRQWLVEVIAQQWGLPVVSISGIHDPGESPGFLFEIDGRPVGAVTYAVVGDECEVVTLNSGVDGQGIGRALMTEAAKSATEAGCRRLWLITTNDNIRAIEFYQRFGMNLAALHRNFVDEVRRHKPGLPTAEGDGVIPFRHALEFELLL